MIRRLCFLSITLFWIAMNVLLWRSEFQGEDPTGRGLPIGVVWQKILTAPDDSAMDIIQRGQHLGYCRLSPNVAEGVATGKTANLEDDVDGRVRQLSGYTLDLDGSVQYSGPRDWLRFNLHLVFATNQVWQALSLRLSLHQATWLLESNARQQTLRLRYDHRADSWERTFPFEELRQPDRLFAELGQPALASLLAGIVLPADPAQVARSLTWNARNDWLKLGQARLRVYRLQARWLDRYEAVLYLSRVGEILKVELPAGLTLMSEAFTRW